MGTTIKIDNARISYPSLFQAKQIAGTGKPKFSAAFLIEETNPKLKELLTTAKALVDAAYPDGTPLNFKSLPCYRAADNPKYKGNSDYDGMWVLNSSKNADQGAPAVVDQNMQAVIDPGKIYPGMVVNVAISVYTYEAKNEKGHVIARGVTTGLEAVQIVRDGDRLDNKPSVGELFKPISVDDSLGSGSDDYDPLA